RARRPAYQNQIGEIAQPQRRWCELREQPANERPRGAAKNIRCGSDARGAAALAVTLAAGIKFGNPGRRRAGSEPGRKSAYSPCGEQPRRALRRGENGGAGNADRDSGQTCRTPADLVGQAAKEQQRCEIAENVSRVDERQCDGRKSKGLAIKRI